MKFINGDKYIEFAEDVYRTKGYDPNECHFSLNDIYHNFGENGSFEERAIPLSYLHKELVNALYEGKLKSDILSLFHKIIHKYEKGEGQDSVFQFTVIDKETSEYPKIVDIVLKEGWAGNLMWMDLIGFAIGEDGHLYLLDECGNYAECPYGRFEIPILGEYFENDGNL